jgi:hypothetical protein
MNRLFFSYSNFRPFISIHYISIRYILWCAAQRGLQGHRKRQKTNGKMTDAALMKGGLGRRMKVCLSTREGRAFAALSYK